MGADEQYSLQKKQRWGITRVSGAVLSHESLLVYDGEARVDLSKISLQKVVYSLLRWQLKCFDWQAIRFMSGVASI